MKITLDLDIFLNFLSELMGENTEVVYHQIDNQNTQSLIEIRNGHVTGREVGMTLTDFAKDMIVNFDPNNSKSHYKVNYLSLAENNKKLRSSSLLVCDEQNIPKGMLCFNKDDSTICNIIQQLNKMIAVSDNRVKEEFSNDVKTINENLINDVVAKYPSPIEHLSTDEKLAFIGELSDKGVFLIKGSIEIVANILGISESTLYRYLKQI